jgi:outer membrane protein assembly factor BamB
MWSTALPGSGRPHQVSGRAGTVFVTMAEGDQQAPVTVAVDAATGQVRWRGPGAALAMSPDAMTVLTVRGESGGQIWRGLRVDTGTQVWGLPVDGADRLYFGSRPAGPAAFDERLPGVWTTSTVVVLSAARGTAQTRDLATGAVGRSGRVVPPGTGIVAAWTPDDQLLVQRADGALAAFALASLDPLWSVPDVGTTDATSCGPAIRAGNRALVRALDRRTGRELWQQKAVGAAGLALPGRTDGPLLGYPMNAEGGLATVGPSILAPDTGRVTMDLAGWRPVDADGPRLLLLRQERPDGDATIGVADLDSLTQRTVGTVPGVRVLVGDPFDSKEDTLEGCRAAASWLTCRRADGAISVWRIIN